MDAKIFFTMIAGMLVCTLSVSVVGAEKIYWAEADSQIIERADLTGTNVEELVPGLSLPIGMTLDPRAGKMYWTIASPVSIQRSNLDGTVVETVLTEFA